MDNRPILFCYDDSEGSRHAIDAAAALFPDRHAGVPDVAPALTVEESYATIGRITPDFAEVNKEDALSRAEIGARLARRAGFEAEAATETAVPTWDGVIDVSEKIDAAAIVVGSRGLTGLRELVEGSFSHDVAEHAGRPVLIVPPSGAKHPQ
jgi:nucleotide-binding universal stress UspA family protein